jgi:hypothetical protein
MSQVRFIPVNQLPDIRRRHPCYTVVGAGKTGMDACLWLLANGAEPERIRWIRSRDPWLLDRAALQPYAENFEFVMRSSIDGFRAILEATSQAELFELLESSGVLMRFDPEVEPRAFRGAVLSRGELEQLRRIKDVVRLGRVNLIETNRVVLDDGTVDADPDTLYIDCSASGITQPPDIAVFEPGVVNLLVTRAVQPAFSAALVGFVEARFDDDETKNAMCQVVPYPSVPLDWLLMWQGTLANSAQWARRPEVRKWIARTRLDAIGAAGRGLDPADPRRHELRRELSETGARAAAKIPELLKLGPHSRAQPADHVSRSGAAAGHAGAAWESAET